MAAAGPTAAAHRILRWVPRMAAARRMAEAARMGAGRAVITAEAVGCGSRRHLSARLLVWPAISLLRRLHPFDPQLLDRQFPDQEFVHSAAAKPCLTQCEVTDHQRS